MSCRYYEECPSRSNWCMGIDSGPFENCVEFLIKDCQNLKDISSCPHWDKILGCYGCNYCGIEHCPYDYENKEEPEDNSNQKRPLVIFKCDHAINTKQAESLRNNFIREIEEGVVLLPRFISVEAVLPADCEIRFVDKDGNIIEGGKVK